MSELDLEEMRADAELCAADARARPGLYETNGHVIADLYDCIAKLCAALKSGEAA